MRSSIHPTVSVVIPTYNRAALIARSLHSVLNQSYRDFEVIVVDDGSTDETAGVVAGFRDQRITYTRLARNTGAGAARNVGIQASKGKFLAFQDSDDEWLPEKLSKHMLVFAQGSPKLGVVYSDKQRLLKNGTTRYHESPAIVPGRLVNPTTQFYQVFRLGIQSIVMKRECLDAAGYFNEALPALEDLELFIRLSKCCDFCHIPEPLVKYYETEGLSKDLYANWVARKLLLKLYYKELLTPNLVFLLKECLWICKTRLNVMGEKRKRAAARTAV
jgi:glycosyltransferase involved in cell wall biosynthesis